MANEFEREMTVPPTMAGRDGPVRTIAADAVSIARANILATSDPAPATEPELAPARNTEPGTQDTGGWPITRPNIPGAEPGESPLMTVFRQARTEIGGWGTRTERADSPGWVPVEYAMMILGGPRRFGPDFGEQAGPLPEGKTAPSADTVEPPQEVQAPPVECKCELTCYRPWYYGIEHLPQGWDFKSCQISVGFYLVGKLSVREKNPPLSKPYHIWCEPEGAVEFLAGSWDEIPKKSDRGSATLDGEIQCTGELSFTMRAKRAGACKVRAKWGEQECPPLNILIREDCSCEILCTYGYVPFPNDWERRLSSSNTCFVPPYGEDVDDGYATLLGRIVLKGSSKERRTLEVSITPVTGVDLAFIERRHPGVIDCWTPLRPKVVQCGTKLDFCAHFKYNGEYELTATWGDLVCKKRIHVGQCDVEEVRHAAALAQSAASVSVSAGAPQAKHLTRGEYGQRLTDSKTGGSVAVVLETPDTEPIQGFIGIRAVAELTTASKWAPRDCCCIFVSDMQVFITLSAYFTGTAVSPFGELLTQLSDFLKGPEAIAKAREALKNFDPQCTKAGRKECKGSIDAKELNDHLTQLFAQFCSDNTPAFQPSGANGLPLQDDDTQYYKPASEWSQTEMTKQCDTARLPVRTMRIRVTISSKKTEAERKAIRKELAEALKGASAILMQCCIRLDPHDIDEAAITMKDPVDEAKAYGGESEEPHGSDIRTHLVFGDNDALWVRDIVTKAPYALGHAEYPRRVAGGKWRYGGIVGIWAAASAVIAHEIGHNAGLATDYTKPAGAQNDHDGYETGEVMAKLAGLRWRGSDCITLRRFVKNLPPYWVKE